MELSGPGRKCDAFRRAQLAPAGGFSTSPRRGAAIADADAETGLVADDSVGFDAGPMVDGVPALTGSRRGVG